MLLTPRTRPSGIASTLRRLKSGVVSDFQRDVARQLGIARAIYLAHASFTQLGEDLVRPEARPGLE